MAVKIRKGSTLDVLNMTPLIDVVFQLLLFFLVATRFAAEDRELEMPLPRASEAQPLVMPPNALTINVTDQGQFFVHGKVMDGNEVERALRQATADNQHQSVFIRADRRVQASYLVFLLNLLKKYGVSEYDLQTEARES
jgi:biopolymer transport protein ExbD